MKDQIMLLGKRAYIAFDEFPHKRPPCEPMELTNPTLKHMVTQGGTSLLESFNGETPSKDIASTGKIYQRSPLHRNRYYLLDEFDKHYCDEFRKFISDAYYYMGASDVQIIENHTVKEEQTDETQRNASAKTDIKGKHTTITSSTRGMAKVGGEYIDSNRQENMRFECNAVRSRMKGVDVKKSKEDFNAWIEKEQIVVDQIPDDNLQLAVKVYMEKGEFKCDASTREWKYKEVLKKVQKARKNIDAYLKVAGSDFSTKLGLNIKCNYHDTSKTHQESEKECIFEYKVIFE